MLPFASITDFIVNAGTDFISSTGLPAVFILMTLESACIPIPSEVIMLYAGYLVHTGDLSFTAAVVAGVAGNVLGSWIAWAVGAYGGRELLERHGRKVHITAGNLALADRWFDQYGPRIVLISRCLPIVRTFISLPAGIARMPFWRFTLYTLLGCIPWVIALTLIGVQVGSAWDTWHSRFEYVDYLVVLAIVAAVGLLVVRHRRARQA
jgi:membrane protein DedA with SNARE-associated domain